MMKLNSGYWKEQNENEIIDNIDKLIKTISIIYKPARQQYRTFYYNVLYYYYRYRILLLKSDTVLDTLDDLQLFTKNWIWYLKWYLNPTIIPITFEEFLNNRSLSKYIQKASKEINYGNSNRNSNHN